MARRLPSSIAAQAIVVGLALGLIGVTAPSASAQKDAWIPSRTPDGQPDIRGAWQTQGGNLTVTLEKGAVTLLDSDKVSFSDAVRPSSREFPIGIVEPKDGKIPLQRAAATRRREIADNYRDSNGDVAYIDPSARCLAAGVPRINYITPYNGYQFLQIPGYVVLFAEWSHETRVIPLDGRPHVTSNIRLWMGDSRGRWEGNTLVVDVTNFNGKAWFDWLTFHSDALHVIERFTIVDADTISYEATIEDPKVFTKPWKIAFPFRRAQPGYRLFEYACHEGNHFMRNVTR